MKRVWICAAALLLTGCTASAQKDEGEPYDDGWREAYATILRGTTAKRFSLVYINADDIPELTLHWSDEGLASHADCPKLYTYYNSTACDLGTVTDDGMDNFSYIERQGIVVNTYITTGAGYQDYLRLSKGELTSEHRLTIDENGMHTYSSRFTIDGEDCTEEEYQEMTAQYDVPELRHTTGDYEVNADNIQAIIMNSDTVG